MAVAPIFPGHFPALRVLPRQIFGKSSLCLWFLGARAVVWEGEQQYMGEHSRRRWAAGIWLLERDLRLGWEDKGRLAAQGEEFREKFEGNGMIQSRRNWIFISQPYTSELGHTGIVRISRDGSRRGAVCYMRAQEGWGCTGTPPPSSHAGNKTFSGLWTRADTQNLVKHPRAQVLLPSLLFRYRKRVLLRADVAGRSHEAIAVPGNSRWVHRGDFPGFLWCCAGTLATAAAQKRCWGQLEGSQASAGFVPGVPLGSSALQCRAATVRRRCRRHGCCTACHSVPELARDQTRALLCLPQRDVIPLAKLWQSYKSGPETVAFAHNFNTTGFI